MKYLIISLLGLFIFDNAFALSVDMDEPKTIKSDKIEYDLKSEELKASGNTEIVNESGQVITSDEIEYNVKTSEIKANGNTEITDINGEKAKLQQAVVSKKTDFMSANDIEIWLGKNVYIRAEEITKQIDETIAKNAVFTACDKCDTFGNAWEISGTKIIRDMSEQMLYFHNAVFWIYNDNIPIFWLPYYEMPDPSVKYKSGLLMPSLNSTNGMGAQINVPVYINLSDTHDLTTTFSFLTKEKPLFQLEHRLNLNHSEFRTHGSFTHNKEGVNRWHIFNDDVIEMGEYARTSIYIQRTSDKTYLQKYGFYNNQPYFDSSAKVELFGQTSYVVADAHIFQELRNNNTIPGDILPNIRGVYQTDPFFAETYLTFTGDVLSVYGENTSNQRLIGEGRIISPWTLWGGNRITLSAASRYDFYHFDRTAVYNSDYPSGINKSYSGIKTRFLPNGYIEWGLPLFDVEDNWTYILEPRARLTIMEHTDSKAVFAYRNDSAGRFLSDKTLFSDNRFAGLDVWENGNFADYGVQWTAFNKKHNVEIFLGQTYDFKKTDKEAINLNDNGFRNGFSDYVGRVSYSNNRNMQLSSRFRFDRENMSLQHIENSVSLWKRNNYLTIGHIWDTAPINGYSDKDTHELRAGAGLQITNRINIKEYVIYNLYEHAWQSHNGGIYYEHPCYYLSVEYKRDNAIRNDYVGGTTFQFRFGISIDGKHY